MQKQLSDLGIGDHSEDTITAFIRVRLGRGFACWIRDAIAYICRTCGPCHENMTSYYLVQAAFATLVSYIQIVSLFINSGVTMTI